MWDELPVSQRNEYKRMILAFASLTEMFAQKADGSSEEEAQQFGTLSPIINSKYRETVFQKVFHASGVRSSIIQLHACRCLLRQPQHQPLQ